jgi:hypothetical protein
MVIHARDHGLNVRRPVMGFDISNKNRMSNDANILIGYLFRRSYAVYPPQEAAEYDKALRSGELPCEAFQSTVLPRDRAVVITKLRVKHSKLKVKLIFSSKLLPSRMNSPIVKDSHIFLGGQITELHDA